MSKGEELRETGQRLIDEDHYAIDCIRPKVPLHSCFSVFRLDVVIFRLLCSQLAEQPF